MKIILETGEETPIDLPKSNVLQLRAPGALVTVRPSGTEPKIKYYASCWDEPSIRLEEAKRRVSTRLEVIRNELAEM